MVGKVYICVTSDSLVRTDQSSKRDISFPASIDLCSEMLNLDFTICLSNRFGLIKGESLPKRIFFLPTMEITASNMFDL